ncbi:hypothetical protein ACHAQJ_009279 [Trichoderma viride]
MAGLTESQANALVIVEPGEFEFMDLQFRGVGYRANGIFFAWWPFMLRCVRKQVYVFQSSDLDPISVDEVMTSNPSTDATLTLETMSEPDPTKFSHNISRPGYAGGSSSETATGPHSVHIATDRSNLSNQSDGTQATYCGSPTPHRGSNPPRPNGSHSHSVAARAFRSIRRRNHERDNAAWSYTKCALLFFTAMLVTWIPSSANRLYSLTHNKAISVPLEFMSVFVLPLQGFWNFLVYVTISWTACKNLFHDMWLAVRSAAISRMDRIRGRTNNEENPESPESPESPENPENSENSENSESPEQLA